jgi:serine phosphatase RsbU (regulator of sigma subunit)
MTRNMKPAGGSEPASLGGDVETAGLLDRLRRLQAVTAALSAASTEDEVAGALLEQGTRAAGATCAVLGIVEARGVLVKHRIGLGGNAPALIAADAVAPLPTAVRSGRPVLLGTRAEWHAQFSPGPRGDFEAFAAVPLLVDGRPVGCLGFGFPDRRYFDAGDLELFEALALQGGQALARAWLHEQQVQLASMLERELLPSDVPAVAQLDVAVRYHPLGNYEGISGDFYDLFPTADDGWIAVIGDVCGKGVEAAIDMLLARHTVRSMSAMNAGLRDFVRVLNQTIIQRGRLGRYCSVAIVRGRPVAGGAHELEYVIAGHPPPLVVRVDGSCDELERGAMLVGVIPSLPVRVMTNRLEADESLVMYTDGVTEARVAGRSFEVDGLAAAITGAAGVGADLIADRIERAVAPFMQGDRRDDMAIMVLAARRARS